MRTRMFAIAAGIIWVGFWPDLLPWWSIASLSLLFFCTGVGLTRIQSNRGEALILMGFLLTGSSWHLYHGEQKLEQQIPLRLEGRDLYVEGYVASIPEPRSVGQSFHFYIEHAQDEFSHRKVLLNTYDDLAFKAGQRWKLVVRLQRPHGSANPGTFDYEGWLFQQGISARGYVRSSEYNGLIAETSTTLLGVRAAFREKLLAITSGLPFQSVLLALTLGDRNLLDDSQWNVFSDTGTNHLVVISGLHIALVAFLFACLVSGVWRFSAQLSDMLPSQQAGALAAIGGALFYAAMADFALPTQRAVIMVVIFVAARMLAVNGNSWFSFFLAMLLVLLWDPMAATGSGFWLSFAAVASLLLTHRRYVSKQVDNSTGNRLQRLLAPQLAVFVGLMVPLGYWQGQVSLLAPAANLVAIPVVSWLVVPMSLLAAAFSPISFFVSRQLFELADRIFGWLYYLLEQLATLPEFGTTWRSNQLSADMLLFAAFGCLLLLLPGIANSRVLGLLLLSPLFSFIPRPEGEGAMAIHVLDVGQGLAVIVRTANHALVYDSGPRFSSGFDSGTAIVAPVLRRLGIKRVQVLVASHADNDHAGGVAGLLENMPIDRLLIGEELPALSEPAERCARHIAWQWDGIDFRFVHPPVESEYSGNNASCVLLISAGEFQVLLPGDIDASIERRLISEFKHGENIEVLVSAHHGSNTSSNLNFLATVRPQLVIHSAGYRNQFGHPSTRVLERVSRIGANQLSTSENGMISIVLRELNEKPEIRLYRDRFKRYWHWSKPEE